MKQYLYLLLATLSLNALNAGGEYSPGAYFSIDDERGLMAMSTGFRLEIESLRNDSEIYQLLVSKMDIYSSSDSESPTRISRDRITQVDASIPNLRNFSLHAFYIFPYLTQLVLRKSQLSELRDDSLKGLRLLTYLDLGNNRIESIAPRTFEQTPLLECLDLSGNRLETVTPGTFSALPRLTTLFLQENNIEQLERDSFRGLVLLKTLNLRSNPMGLAAIVSGALDADVLPELTSLHIDHINEES